MHRPFLTDNELRSLTGDQALASGNQLRIVVENYLKEMNVPQKYTELMFSVPRESIQWINTVEIEADLEGFIPELRDWIKAQCDKRTDVEKTPEEALKGKSRVRMTPAEKSLSDMLLKKMGELVECESTTLSGLSHQAHLKMFWEPKKSAICADYRSDGQLDVKLLDAKLAAATPNDETAAALRQLSQTAAICGDVATSKKITLALAERGDAGAQSGLGSSYFYGADDGSEEARSCKVGRRQMVSTRSGSRRQRCTRPAQLDLF